MRLNRVLLLAATINILIFALAFTISCSDGDNGPRGRDADHCVVNDDWDIVCTDNSGNKSYPGHLNGGNGPKGPTGQTGKKGDGCWLGDKVGSGYQVLCGPAGSGEVKGTLDGCELSFKGNYEVDITCGPTSLGLCSGTGFNPDSSYCQQGPNGGVVQKLNESDFKYCKNVRYNNQRQYCGYSEKDPATATEPSTVYDRCFLPNGSNVAPNETAWKKEFCQYTDEKTAKLGQVTSDPYTSGYCEDGNAINKDSWQGQYCGYKDKNATKRSMLTGACENEGVAVIKFKEVSNDPNADWTRVVKAKGPNAVAFGQGYCEVKFEDKSTLKTTYSEQLCGTAANNKPNNGKWSNEYCGYADSTSKIPTKIYNDRCDDGSKPYGGNDFPDIKTGDRYYSYASEGEVNGSDIIVPGTGNTVIDTWNSTSIASYGYGTLLYRTASAGFNHTKGSGTKYFCGWANKAGQTPGGKVSGTTLMEACPVVTNRTANPPTISYTTFNKTKWNNDYCGYSKDQTIARSAATGYKRDTLYVAGLCSKEVGVRPNLSGPSYNIGQQGAYARIYKAGAGNNTGTGVKVDGEGNYPSGLDKFSAPNGYWGGFCASTDNDWDPSETSLSVAFCNGKPVPKGSYCGKPAPNFSTDSVYTGACGDGYGPNSHVFGMRFCGYKFKADKTTSALILCGEARTTKYNVSSWVGDYCGYDYGEDYATKFKDATYFNNAANVSKYKYVAKTQASWPTVLYQKQLCHSNVGGFDSIPVNSTPGSSLSQGADPSYRQQLRYDLIGGTCQADGLDGDTELKPRSEVCWENGVKKPINVGAWKGEYCVGTPAKGVEGTTSGSNAFKEGDQKVLTCKAGWEPKNWYDKATTCIVPTPEQKKLCQDINNGYSKLNGSNGQNKRTGEVFWRDSTHQCIWETASLGEGLRVTASRQLIDYKDALEVCGEGPVESGRTLNDLAVPTRPGTFTVKQGFCWRGLTSTYKTPELCKEAGDLTWDAASAGTSPWGTYKVPGAGQPIRGEGDLTSSTAADRGSTLAELNAGTGKGLNWTSQFEDNKMTYCQGVLTANPSTCDYKFASNGQDISMIPTIFFSNIGKSYPNDGTATDSWAQRNVTGSGDVVWSPSYIVEGTCELKLKNVRKAALPAKKIAKK